MNYEQQIDKAIKEYENCRPYHQHSIEWICNRIDWCWKWRKINEKNKNDFVDRIVKIMEDSI